MKSIATLILVLFTSASFAAEKPNFLFVMVDDMATMLSGFPVAENKRPHVLIIYADDLGYGDIGCYGATKLKTPNIDRLANEGMRFMNAYTTSSTCSQSRYGLMTGRYWWRNPLHPPIGVVEPAGPSVLIEKDVTPMPRVFKNYGYRTAVFGKWHLGVGTGNSHKDRYDWNQPEIKNGPLDVGFDYFNGNHDVRSSCCRKQTSACFNYLC